jgi:hypothetical protein
MEGKHRQAQQQHRKGGKKRGAPLAVSLISPMNNNGRFAENNLEQW